MRVPFLLVALALACSACFVVTDLDRFDKRGQSSSNFNDLRFTTRGFTSHVNEYFEYRVVDAKNVIQSRGIVLPLGGPGTTIFARGAVPKQNGPFRLDFFSDHDMKPGYTDTSAAMAGDHSWRIPLTDNLLNDDDAFVVSFDHNTSFNFLNDPEPPKEFGKPAVVRLKNMGAFIGKRVEVRVADASSGRYVALFRVPAAAMDAFDATVPGMIELNTTYTVEVYTDDGASTPASVQAFRMDATGTATGLDVTFDPAGPGVTRVNDAPSP
jgi:hypothetical protein